MNPGECRWVGCEERLPEIDKHGVSVYLTVRADGQIMNDVFYDAGDGTWTQSGGESPAVTHWLEVLPPPIPKRKVFEGKEMVVAECSIGGKTYRGLLSEEDEP